MLAVVGENGLDAGLRVVEVAAHGADADIPAALGLHLRLLHVADAVFRVKDDDARARHVAKALQRRLAGVAAGGGKHGNLFPRARLVARGGHQARQKRERHVLEGAGGAAEEFKHVGVADLDKRRQFVRLEFSGVALAHDAGHLLCGKAVKKGGQHPRGDVHGAKLQHFFYVQTGERLRRVQAAVRRDAFQNGFPGGRARAAARTLIELHRNTRFLPFTCRQNYDIVFPSKIQVFFLSRHVKLS